MDDVDLVVVAGGAARRLGGVDKAMLPMPDGRPVLAHVLAAAVTRRIVVGPHRDLPGGTDVDVWAREDPPGGGPVAGLAAGLAVARADLVAVLAGDLPFGADAVPFLVEALAGHDVAVVVADGRRQHLLAVWRRTALTRALDRLGAPAGAAVRELLRDADVVEVEDRAQWSRDLDTPTDVRRHTGLRPRDGVDRGGGGPPGVAG